MGSRDVYKRQGTDITGVQAPLNNTGDYRIVVVSDQGAGPLSYSLTAEIP